MWLSLRKATRYCYYYAVEVKIWLVMFRFFVDLFWLVIWFCSVQLQYDIDESYKLNIHPKGNPIYAYIEVGFNDSLTKLELVVIW